MYPWSSRCGLTKRAETKKKKGKEKRKGRGKGKKEGRKREKERERRIFARRGTGVWSRG